MPYLTKESKGLLNSSIINLLNTAKKNIIPFKPMLAYVISKLIIEFINGEESYDKWSDVIGALESTKLEIYRRWVAKYEDTKIEINGDI